MVVLDRFTAGRPCELVASMPCKPHLLFSDGALEYDEHDNPRATIGCVLMQRDGIILCSGCVVPDQLLGMWQAGGRTHVIGLVELYVVGLSTWKKVFRNDRVILLTDSCHKCIWHIQRFVWNVQTTLFWCYVKIKNLMSNPMDVAACETFFNKYMSPRSLKVSGEWAGVPIEFLCLPVPSFLSFPYPLQTRMGEDDMNRCEKNKCETNVNFVTKWQRCEAQSFKMMCNQCKPFDFPSAAKAEKQLRSDSSSAIFSCQCKAVREIWVSLWCRGFLCLCLCLCFMLSSYMVYISFYRPSLVVVYYFFEPKSQKGKIHPWPIFPCCSFMPTACAVVFGWLFLCTAGAPCCLFPFMCIWVRCSSLEQLEGSRYNQPNSLNCETFECSVSIFCADTSIGGTWDHLDFVTCGILHIKWWVGGLLFSFRVSRPTHCRPEALATHSPATGDDRQRISP